MRHTLTSRQYRDKARERNGFDIIHAVHEAEYKSLDVPPEPAHKLEVTLESDDFTDEKYKLFQDYQKHVHDDDSSTPSGFKRFLCSSPLSQRTENAGTTSKRLGSYHQCYRLDGRLIAMAVLDLLPHCVSGVYFIYHQDFEMWSFGKLSAVREAALALQGGYEHYYMGYYIHSCAKMRYKGDYKPQYILDLENHQWDPLDEDMRSLLDRQRYASRSKHLAPTAGGVEDDDEQSEAAEANTYRTTVEAAEYYENGGSVFDLNVPGVMTVDQVRQHVKIDDMRIKIRPDITVPAKYLRGWEESDLAEGGSLKGIIAEYAACVGAEVANEAVVQFGSG